MSVLSRMGFGRGRSGNASSPSDPTYTLREMDRPLIDAALKLGDWILDQPDTGRGQKKAVTALQDALRCLPGRPPWIIAEYGFHVRYESQDGKGLYRAWRVALSPAGLEIYSVYSPDVKIDIEEKLTHELNFWLRPSRDSRHDGYYFDEWISEVADPDQFRTDGGLFGVMAEVEAAPRR